MSAFDEWWETAMNQREGYQRGYKAGKREGMERAAVIAYNKGWGSVAEAIRKEINND
jgi:hypothetical protein